MCVGKLLIICGYITLVCGFHVLPVHINGTLKLNTHNIYCVTKTDLSFDAIYKSLVDMIFMTRCKLESHVSFSFRPKSHCGEYVCSCKEGGLESWPSW